MTGLETLRNWQHLGMLPVRINRRAAAVRTAIKNKRQERYDD
jgi:hypothetical protein